METRPDRPAAPDPVDLTAVVREIEALHAAADRLRELHLRNLIRDGTVAVVAVDDPAAANPSHS